MKPGAWTTHKAHKIIKWNSTRVRKEKKRKAKTKRVKRGKNYAGKRLTRWVKVIPVNKYADKRLTRWVKVTPVNKWRRLRECVEKLK